MPSTTRLALPYPASSDTADVPRDISALANALDSNAAYDAQGSLSSRPAAGLRGRYYYANDTGVLSRDTGTAWVDVNPADAAAGTASMRTLGTGATQAAAGNDSRLTDARTPLDNSVSTAKIQDGAVTTDKIADGTILSQDIADAQITGLKMSSAMRGEWRVAAVWSAGNAGFTLTATDGTTQMDSSYFPVNMPQLPGGMTRVWSLTYVGWTPGSTSIVVRDAFRTGTVNSGSVSLTAGPFYKEINLDASGDIYGAPTLKDSSWTYLSFFNSNGSSIHPIMFGAMIRYRLVAV